MVDDNEGPIMRHSVILELKITLANPHVDVVLDEVHDLTNAYSCKFIFDHTLKSCASLTTHIGLVKSTLILQTDRMEIFLFQCYATVSFR